VASRPPALFGAGLVALVFALYLPVRDFELAGDDFLLVQLAHRTTHEPRALVASLGGFYRPTTTWTLALDRALWGTWAGGYHLTNVAIRSLAALALFAAVRRLGLGPPAATLISALWALSPFTGEPVLVVGARIDDLLLLGWLALVLLWPGAGEPFRPGRLLAAGAATAWLLLSKETWVVTPGLVGVLEAFGRRTGGRRALRSSLLAATAVLLYLAAYFFAFPTSKGYYRWDPSVLAKLPHELAVFLYLEPLRPMAFRATAVNLLALGAVAAAAAHGLRRRSPAAAVGAALLLLPNLPTLFVPYLPVRYTSIPYAGFLLVVAAFAGEAMAGARPAGARAAKAAVAGLALLVLLASVRLTRVEIEDAAELSRAHARLVEAARAVAPELPLDRPVLLLRSERENPLHDIASSVRGLPKYYFVRHDEPLGLTSSAALFEWVLDREEVVVEGFPGTDGTFAGQGGALLAFRPEGFVWVGRDEPDLGAVAGRWRQAGGRARFLRARRLDDP
jgi:hypothetical protein